MRKAFFLSFSTPPEPPTPANKSSKRQSNTEEKLAILSIGTKGAG